MKPETELALRACSDLGDWFVIERYEKPGTHREWDEERVSEWGRCVHFCHSARFSDNADIEGSAIEMLLLAEAIEKRRVLQFKRCAVNATKEPVEFWSPRNSRAPGAATREAAEALAREIRAALGGRPR